MLPTGPKHVAYIMRLWLLNYIKNDLKTPPEPLHLNTTGNLEHSLHIKVTKKKNSNKSELR